MSSDSSLLPFKTMWWSDKCGQRFEKVRSPDLTLRFALFRVPHVLQSGQTKTHQTSRADWRAYGVPVEG